jgi:hypothetical protein
MSAEQEIKQEPMTTTAATMMLGAMRDLREKKIEAKEAQAIAQLGMGVIQAANAEIQFIRATKAIPCNSGMGDRMRFLEPQSGGKD